LPSGLRHRFSPLIAPSSSMPSRKDGLGIGFRTNYSTP
jgi:hypothetical protein